jgi:signal peptidase II
MLILLVGITGLVITIDQVVKYLAFKQEIPLFIFNGLIEIVHARNDGVAFGIGGGIKHGAIVLSILSIFTIAFLIVFYIKYTRQRILDTFAISFIIGGATGNLIDRIFNKGKVLDFIQLRFINWPAFNFADILIVAGVILMIFAIAFDKVEYAGKRSCDNQVPKMLI